MKFMHKNLTKQTHKFKKGIHRNQALLLLSDPNITPFPCIQRNKGSHLETIFICFSE